MSDFENNITILSENIEDELLEETRAAIDADQSICPDFENESEESLDKLPPLPIDLPDMDQINPFKKIRKHNRINNTIIITIVSIIVIVAAIFITKYLNYKSGKVIYCQANPVVVFEAIIDSFSSPGYTPNLSLVISENNGHFLDINNHYFEIYDADNNQYYQVSDKKAGNHNNICLKIAPKTKRQSAAGTFSLKSIINAITSVLKKEDFDEDKMFICFFARKDLIFDEDYYFNSNTNTFISKDEFLKLASDYDICLIHLDEPKITPPKDGVLMGSDIRKVSIAVLF